MRGNARLGGENRKHRHLQAGNSCYDACRLRTHRAILFDFVTEAVQEETLPTLSPRHGTLLRRNILQVWNLFFMLQQYIEFFADDGPACLHFSNPRKSFGLEE